MIIDYNKYTLNPEESRNWGFVAGACGLIVYAGVYYVGFKDRAFFAAISVSAVIFAGLLRRDLIRQIWYWILLIIFLIIHIYFVFAVLNYDFRYPGILMLPVVLLDVILMFHAIFAVEYVMGKRS